MKRNATAIWNGSGKEGNGTLTTQSSTLNNTPYTYVSRFESGNGTNPEELIAAAHAGCFTMKISFLLGAAGFTPEKIETNCEVTLKDGVLSDSHLKVNASVPGISKEKFDEIVEESRANCIISKALNLNITAETMLNQ